MVILASDAVHIRVGIDCTQSIQIRLRSIYHISKNIYASISLVERWKPSSGKIGDNEGRVTALAQEVEEEEEEEIKERRGEGGRKAGGKEKERREDGVLLALSLSLG